jgi:hypothetical protein
MGALQLGLSDPLLANAVVPQPAFEHNVQVVSCYLSAVEAACRPCPDVVIGALTWSHVKC